MFLHHLPPLDGEVEDGETGGREFRVHTSESVAVAEAGEQGRKLGHAWIVANHHKAAYVAWRAADDLQQRVRLGEIDGAVEPRLRMLVRRFEREIERLPGAPRIRGNDEVGEELLVGEISADAFGILFAALGERAVMIAAAGFCARFWRDGKAGA